MGSCASSSAQVKAVNNNVVVKSGAKGSGGRNVQPNQSNKPEKANKPCDYSELEKIPNLRKLKVYKKFPDQIAIVQPHYLNQYYYAPNLVSYQQDINAGLYYGCNFHYPYYISAIPKKKKKDATTISIDESKTLFFKIGHAPVYSESIYVYIGSSYPESIWADIENPVDYVQRKMSIPANVQTILTNESLRKELMQAGWFVIIGHKWGFLLNLESLNEAYQGYLPNRWRVLLTQPYFIEIFEQFGSYMQDIYQEADKKDNKKGSTPTDIPSTDFDPFLPPSVITLDDQLFWRQKQEVAWMFRLENAPVLKIKKKLNALPFLDTGHYLDLANPTGFLSPNAEDEFMNVIMPGGILASQIGSGKTVTAIGLMTIGSQFKYNLMPNNANFVGSNVQMEMNELSYWLDGVYEPSLVIVTKNILGQWAEEINRFAPHLQVAFIETAEGLQNVKVVQIGSQYTFENFDIILTHRQVIQDGHLIQQYCPDFFKVTFKRVIMDEFHELTTMMKKHFRVVQKPSKKGAEERINMLNFFITLNKIDRRFTWGITGTPDSLDYYNDTTPLFKLLSLNEEYNTTHTFAKIKEEFVLTCMRKNPRSVDLPPLQKIIQKVHFGELQNILYRGLMNHPSNKKEAEEVCSHLMPQWRQFESSNDPIQKVIQAIQKKQEEEVIEVQKKLKIDRDNEALKARLEVLHSEGNFFNDVIRVVMQDAFECTVCMVKYPIEKIVISGCMHCLCVSCYESLQKSLAELQCPVCRESIKKSELLMHPQFRVKSENKLTSIISAIRQTPPDEKVIVFTQFHSLVEHLSEMFTESGIQYTVLKGQPSDINISLARFRCFPELKVLLMSIEQSASGINITMANHVFFAHPIFGMEFEKAALTYNQCVGRAYRTGQMKPVYVKLFVTLDSIEEEMMSGFTKYTDTLN